MLDGIVRAWTGSPHLEGRGRDGTPTRDLDAALASGLSLGSHVKSSDTDCPLDRWIVNRQSPLIARDARKRARHRADFRDSTQIGP
jgi:hypothetical protein